MIPPPFLLWVAVVGLLLSGCASGYQMKVDAISRPKPAAKEEPVSYRIRNKNPEDSDDSLRYKEAAKFVKTALSGKGMYEVADSEKADMVVDIDYGMSPPKGRVETVSEPVYITVPGPVTYQTMQVGSGANGTPIYRTIAVQGPPRTEYVGEREYLVMRVTYEKYLHLTARENQPGSEGRPPPEIWTIDVTSEGESKNLRKYLPALAAASIDYIGKDTRGQKDIRLKDEKDGAVAFVKKGL
ncbi:MAG: hypothetical protein EXS39_07290 [Opitutaceae bacterium]|nr:hypothetical protein [Opitutaceae bacterium]